MNSYFRSSLGSYLGSIEQSTSYFSLHIFSVLDGRFNRIFIIKT